VDRDVIKFFFLYLFFFGCNFTPPLFISLPLQRKQAIYVYVFSPVSVALFLMFFFLEIRQNKH